MLDLRTHNISVSTSRVIIIEVVDAAFLSTPLSYLIKLTQTLNSLDMVKEHLTMYLVLCTA